MAEKRKLIKIGETYDNIQVLGTADRAYKCYICKCLKCGKEFELTGSKIFKYASMGCIDCRNAERRKNREAEARKYVGQTFGNLKVINCRMDLDKHNYSFPLMECQCTVCGSITGIPLAKLKAGPVSYTHLISVN